MNTWDRLKGLPLSVESYSLEGLELQTNSGWTRRTTVVSLHGSGATGRGEDVIYDGETQAALQARAACLALAGDFDLASFSAHLDELELDPDPYSQDAYRHYRRWAYESAALDLALRQNDLDAAQAFGRELRPLNFAFSTGLSSFDTVAELLAMHANMRFKLDATVDWDEPLCQRLAQTGAVDVIDFKGAYQGTIVDTTPDVELYRRVLDAFGPALIVEDPHTTPEVLALLRERKARVGWDAPMHSVLDIDAMPIAPDVLNVKPSRFGRLEELCAVYDTCTERGLPMYGGGQFELGIGREQIQLLAALFHADASNDVAPRGYHQLTSDEPRPAGPLTLKPASAGFSLA